MLKRVLTAVATAAVLQLYPCVLPVLIQAVSPVTSLCFASSYTSCFSSYAPSCCQFLYKLSLQLRLFVLAVPISDVFFQLRPFVFPVLIQAVSPVTFLHVASSYTSCISSHIPACCQFLYQPFRQLRLFVLPVLIPDVFPVTSLRVASSYTSCFSCYVPSCCNFLCQLFLQLCPFMLPVLIKLFLQLRPFLLPVFIPAVSPVTSLRVTSFYISRFSSYVSSCFQF